MDELNEKAKAARRILLTLMNVESPFPWQLALLGRLVERRIPASVDVPTGLGKTAVMQIWLAARAVGAVLPRRLVYVVDRRAVVDQATTIAEELRDLVEKDPELKRSLGLKGPLPISTLRGKHLDNRQWLADPTVPAIVLGTVDMIGSRLLFGGYGVSRRMRPYHAGLLGADSLIVLDEAHLVPPFQRLIEAIVAGRDVHGRTLRPEEKEGHLIPPSHLLSLSATGKLQTDAITLTAADRKHSVVSQRLKAKKHLSVRPDVAAQDLAQTLAREAWALSGEGTQPLRIIVFCNSRDDASKVQELLRAKAKTELDIELFVGARRYFERERAAEWLDQRGFFAGSKGRPKSATFVIATSAGEVGVDLDADHMVCDLVAWERMVQRLGRVNRRGEREATIVVVPAKLDEGKGKIDESILPRRAAVRDLLRELPHDATGASDASPGALTDLKGRDAEIRDLIRRASTPEPLHPPLNRATLEAWSMTSLEEHTGRPEVTPWVRGWIEEEFQTTIVWRRYLPLDGQGNLLAGRDVEAYREAAEPHLAERLEANTARVCDWLIDRLKTLRDKPEESAQNTESIEGEAGKAPLLSNSIAALILDDPSVPVIPIKAKPWALKDKKSLFNDLVGRTILVDARLGGLKDGLLDETEAAPAIDVTLEDKNRTVPFRVLKTDNLDLSRADKWRAELRIAVHESNGEEDEWLVVESLVLELAESEEGRSTAKNKQILDEHEQWAEEQARGIAIRLGLPPPYQEMLEVAARLHDEGKRAVRWQRAFNAPAGGPYAKTTSRPNQSLLDGYRHELGSLPYAERHPRFRALAEPLRDLCLHLIAAHHGNARPFIRTKGAEEPPTRLTERAKEIALRFTRLERRWGPWGLAWWEALLRAADVEASRLNDLRKAKPREDATP